MYILRYPKNEKYHKIYTLPSHFANAAHLGLSRHAQDPLLELPPLHTMAQLPFATPMNKSAHTPRSHWLAGSW